MDQTSNYGQIASGKKTTQENSETRLLWQASLSTREGKQVSKPQRQSKKKRENSQRLQRRMKGSSYGQVLDATDM